MTTDFAFCYSLTDFLNCWNVEKEIFASTVFYIKRNPEILLCFNEYSTSNSNCRMRKLDLCHVIMKFIIVSRLRHSYLEQEISLIFISEYDSRTSRQTTRDAKNGEQCRCRHRIGRHTEVPHALEALKFVSSRISHCACCPPLLWPVNDIFWPINTLYWLAAPPSGQ